MTIHHLKILNACEDKRKSEYHTRCLIVFPDTQFQSHSPKKSTNITNYIKTLECFKTIFKMPYNFTSFTTLYQPKISIISKIHPSFLNSLRFGNKTNISQKICRYCIICQNIAETNSRQNKFLSFL